jgi:PIN domain nuclease of toxin-antitoxin system
MRARAERDWLSLISPSWNWPHSREGRLHLELSLESVLAEVEARFIVLPISGRACVRALDLPAAYPRDPADRIIGATALVEGLSLVTADRKIQQSRTVRTIW